MSAFHLTINMGKVYEIATIALVLLAILVFWWGLMSFNLKKEILGILAFVVLNCISFWVFIHSYDMKITKSCIQYFLVIICLNPIIAVVNYISKAIFQHSKQEEIDRATIVMAIWILVYIAIFLLAYVTE